jgi:hypothetical protein
MPRLTARVIGKGESRANAALQDFVGQRLVVDGAGELKRTHHHS